jgi:hypothetical protein
VVTWGILAYLASTPRARRWLSALSAITSLGVGLTTVYLGTHWLSDVLLGWAAGLLILLALPWFEPLIAKTETRLFDLRDRWRVRRSRPVPEPAAPLAPVLLKTPRGAEAEQSAPAREPVSSTRASRGLAHLAPGPHTARSERSPVTPAGSRRPPGRRPGTPRRLPAGGPSPDRRLTAGTAAGPVRTPPRATAKAPPPHRGGAFAVRGRGRQPFQARATRPSRTSKLSRPTRYSMVMIASGGSDRTVDQPRCRASRSALAASRPTYPSGLSWGSAGGGGIGAMRPR